MLTLTVPASASVPILNEFMAVNDSGLRDDDGDLSDWIEIYNPGTNAVDIGGWYLTDDIGDLTKWEFPSTNLAAGAYLVVFASGKNRANPGEGLHANFKLGSGGEYLGLVMPDGVTVASAYSPAYPQQYPDVSYGFAAASGNETWLLPGAPCTYLVPPDGSLGSNWTDRTGFDDSTWASGTTGIGYATDGDTNYLALIGADVEGLMYNTRGSIYIRIPFVVEDASGFTSIQLRMKYDDGFVASLNGVEVASRNAPASPQWNSTASAVHPDQQAVVFETLDIPDGENSLVRGSNLLAIHGLNASLGSSDLLVVPEVVGRRGPAVPTTDLRYFQVPTPGEGNGVGTADLGPILGNVMHAPLTPDGTQDLLVSATIDAGEGPVTAAALHYRVMYGPEVSTALLDDGLHDDGAAGDGLYGGRIPAAAYSAGDMVRYFVTAEDDRTNVSRWPLEEDQARYLGTVVKDLAPTNGLPVLHWFVPNPIWYRPNGYNTKNWSEACLFYLGRFYDNVRVRVRGQTASTFPNPPFKFEFNKGHYFYYAPDRPLEEEININSFHSDKAFMRQTLAAELYRDSEVPASETFPLRVQQNGAFYAVAVFVEQVDERLLERQGLDPNGALYKMYNEAVSATDKVEKRTRKNESNDDLAALVDGVASWKSVAQRTTYVFDNVDIPSYINVLVATALMHDRDGFNKNHYLYRDTEGNREWTMLPWDKDLTFGRNWSTSLNTVLNDEIDYTDPPVQYLSTVHRVSGALLENPRILAMYARRIRTVMDAALQPPSTPFEQRRCESRVRAWQILMDSDVTLHRAKWGNPFGSNQTFADGIGILINRYLEPRRSHLYVTHHEDNGGIIPDAQADRPTLQFGQILVTPPSGNQDEEYIELINPNPVAVDLSGWCVTNAVSLTFKPGVVLDAGGALYLSPRVVDFRTRPTSPTGGEDRFVQGDYQGHLSAWGETIELRDASGALVNAMAYAGAPSLQQRGLRITEIMYDPADPPPGSPYEDGNFEYIELQNISSDTLDLTGVRFTGGIQYTFTNGVTSLPPQGIVVVVRDLAAFATRYQTNLITIAGTFTGKFANLGEQLKLEDPLNDTILSFAYSDGWYPETDGGGYSLTVADAAADHTAWGQSTQWRPSVFVHGSPGWDDSGLVDGDEDGQPDPWEIEYFGAIDATGGGAADDFDGDGTPNDAEYIAGTDPADAGSLLMLGLSHAGPDPVVSFQTRAAAGPSYARQTRFYSLESAQAADALHGGNWAGIPGYTNILGQDHTVTYTNTPGGGVRHFRARAWLITPE